MAKYKKQSAASHAGFHFLNLYQCCPRKFYLKFIAGIEDKYMARPLIYGAAFHEAKARWYLTGDKDKAINTGVDYIAGLENKFANEADYTESMMRIVPLIKNWINVYGIDDLRNYKVFAVETELMLSIDGYEYTGRPDTILQKNKTGEYYCMETKTSGFSKDLTYNAVLLGDQATSYYMLIEQAYGIKLTGLIVDIAFQAKYANATPDCSRGPPITRTSNDVENFKRSVVQLAADISSRASAVINDKINPFQVFPRNGYYCNSYNKSCEFADICRLNIDSKTKLPSNFKRNKNINLDIKKDLFKPVADIIAT